MDKHSLSVVVIGAGPAGLTAAYLLSKQGVAVTVLEADGTYVGGIARTVWHKGFGFDIGGHRFFSKSAEVNTLWDEILPDDLLTRPRKSRIYFGGRFYPYPLEIKTTLKNLGVMQSALCALSYAKARILRRKTVSFEDWVTNHFGARLFRMFFKTYTEKVWGMKCSEISADWAAERIKGLSFIQALMPQRKSTTIKSLIHTFRYPRKGPGMMWEKAAEKITAQGGQIHMGASVTSLTHATKNWQVRYRDARGEQVIEATHVISSMPLRELVLGVSPTLPDAARAAANALSYRDFLTVALIVKDRGVFDDNWIYVHEPNVKVGRIQNFKSWSPEMVPDAKLNCYGMEYFCFEGDGLWASSDADLVALASRELVSLGIAAADDVIEGVVVRQKKAYPVYDAAYETHVNTIRAALATHCPNLHVIGRAGMHKYNNQDHAMMTAMLTVENILTGSRWDVWEVNQDAEYHETMRGDAGERLVPKAA